MRPDAPTRAGSDGADRLLLGLAVAGAALAAWVWSTGELGGLLFAGHWPAVAPAVAVGVLVRLPGHLGDPRLAWPPADRGSLPGWAILGPVGAVLACPPLAAVALLLRHGNHRLPAPSARSTPMSPRTRRGRVAGGATWARRRELAALIVPQPLPGRLVLGTAGRQLVATEARHSLLVFGPTQSGKTTGLAVPAILEWDGPVVATSVKADLAGATIGWRRRQGRCWVFDPTGTAGLGTTSGWSPVAEAADWSGAQRVASWMVDAAPARSGMGDGAFWFAAAAKQLAPLLLAARRGGLDMASVVRWTNTDEWDQPGSLLEAAGEAEAIDALAACAGRDDRIRSSVGTTLETVLAPFEDPTVIRSTAGADIDPDALLDGRHTLYLCGPTYEQARLQGLLAALVSSVVAAAVGRATASGAPLDPPLLLVLDEAANIAPIRDLDSLASTGAGLGIQLVTVCQDLAQFTTRYGAERARTIANNHRAKLVLSGVSDLTTLDLLSGLAGEKAVREESVTTDLRDGRRTRSTSVAFRRLAPSDELRRVPPGTGVLIYGHLPPARLALRPWYADRGLRRRAGTAPTGASGGLLWPRRRGPAGMTPARPAGAAGGHAAAPGGDVGVPAGPPG